MRVACTAFAAAVAAALSSGHGGVSTGCIQLASPLASAMDQQPDSVELHVDLDL